MKFGLCLSSNDAVKTSALGADYVELNGMQIHAMSDEEFAAFHRLLTEREVPTYSVNGLVIGDLRLTGDIDRAKIRAYADRLFYRLAELKVSMLVFGSGKAKHVPDGFPMEKAWEQLYEVGAIFSECAKPFGQTIAVEGLRYAEVNIVNTIEDVARYVHAVSQPNFLMHVDFYHMEANHESLDVLDKYASEIVHVHIASATREMIGEGDRAFVEERLARLQKIGYTGRVSFEGSYQNGLEGVPAMMQVLRSCILR